MLFETAEFKTAGTFLSKGPQMHFNLSTLDWWSGFEIHGSDKWSIELKSRKIKLH